ncbi:MAG: Rrf2 family transcriptional regulator [Actinomycetota bacterium]|nr:Rrf2 family transcriptional regulator [Actinomycetota bacterium]
MRISARVDYAIRATLELAAGGPEPLTSERIAAAQRIPVRFLQSILSDLTAARLVVSIRGREGGYRLARPASQISIADIMRVEQGFLADIHGQRPEDVDYPGVAQELTKVWVAARASYRAVLERVTLADVMAGRLPDDVADLLTDEDAWVSGSDR